MRALYIRKPLEAEVGEVDAPNLNAGEVLLRVRFVGMCGSDLSSFRGKNPLVSYWQQSITSCPILNAPGE